MGKIFSPPKMPSLPAIPEPTPVETPAVEEETGPTPDELRVQNILARHRGRLGTISTSFRGVLTGNASDAPVRKTLLGD